MRYVILGAGAIGGSIGGKLAAAGKDVTLVARGAHLEALQQAGLELRDPDSTVRLRLPAVASPEEAGLRAGDCVIVATKAQQCEAALDALRAAAGSAVDLLSVVLAQNGVEGERLALRRFARVYGMRVVLAGTHLEPGVVEIATAPLYGLLDVGRYPSGEDETSRQLAADLTAAGFDGRSRPAVMSLKYLKLLSNVANALDAATGDLRSDRARAIVAAAQDEARACYAAAGIELADEDEDAARRRLRGHTRPVGGLTRHGSSSWQSLERRTGDIEADYLNGEIVLLGRLYGVATPVNAVLQQTANRLAREGRPPGSLEVEEIEAALGELAGR
ncbi:MAG TPA: 2-dehydropantoate 2-reductase [Acidimicrobiales bacterium]|nr:2-dehydropantoate 2-reductase [Acidimicrobiales bacterium]